MAQDRDDRPKSLTFPAAQVDFEEAGELMLFINEKQIAFLEALMWEQGFLDARQMAGAFQLLRSNDLVWSRIVREYLLGQRSPMSALMAWNADGTRLPYRMHSEYLNQLFLRNDLSEGRYKIDGSTVSIGDIRVPVFLVATQTDHVAPWRSVYKFHELYDGELTMRLANGGHSAGIVSDPRDEWRTYQWATRPPGQHTVDPELWLRSAPAEKGSWWPQWFDWLKMRSSALDERPPPPLGGPAKLAFGDAPGEYVRVP